MTQATFDTWLRDSRCLKVDGGTLVVAVKNGYAKDWLDARLLPTVKRTIARLTGQTLEVTFVVRDGNSRRGQRTALSIDAPEERGAAAPSGSSTPAWANSATSLEVRCTFERFVVGPNNRLAHAAALAVSERPAAAYNPLFIYGGVGLGKTHLMQAIGHNCQAQGLRVLYITTEDFTNDLIESIRSRATDSFRDKYRTTDVLLVDDVQFIAGKERTQEEFFHTFNTLHRTGKQIVITSDRPPKAMSTLEERLCSRFEWGLIADIQPPDLETRTAILRSKAERLVMDIPDNILDIIAFRVPSNIRELEGALNRVVALVTLTRETLTPETVATALDNVHPPRHHKLAPERIIETVASHFGTTISQLEGPSRRRVVVRPRQIAMYLMRNEAGMSLPKIGEMLGGRDHTTVLHGCARIADMIEENTAFQREVTSLRQNLYQGHAVS